MRYSSSALFLIAAALTGGAAPAAGAEEIARGLSVEATYVGDMLGNARGGRERGIGWIGRADLAAELDGGALGLTGVTAFVDMLYTHGPDFTERYLGEGQAASGIQGDGRVKPIEAWLSVPLAKEKLVAKAGLIDLNTQFDVQEVGAFFVNSSFGMGPEFAQSGENGPSSFPATALGLVLETEGQGWGARVAAFDAVAGKLSDPRVPTLRLPGIRGALLVAEADVRLGAALGAKIGGWTYTSRFDALAGAGADGAPRRLASSRGAYAMVEGRLAGRDDRALEGWVRVGMADDQVNPIGTYAGGGIVLVRGKHRWGAAFAHARLGDPAIAAIRSAGEKVDRAETVLELSYGWQVNDRLRVQPDLQYIVNPGWRSDRADALLLGLRVALHLF